jgi:cytochrome c peroxidase
MKSYTKHFQKIVLVTYLVLMIAAMPFAHASNAQHELSADDLDRALTERLKVVGFTGKIQNTLQKRLGRSINPALADIGRLLWFDTITSLGNDNNCSGCHSPLFGFGDSQSIAIGVENNGIVGPERKGPRNQRRTPQAINTAFFPALMWNGRFASNTQDPFDVTQGARVPFFLGGTTVWRPESSGNPATSFDPEITTTLLSIQANFPPTEKIEVAGHALDTPGLVDDREPAHYPPHLVSSGLMSDTVPDPIAGPNGNPPDSIDRSYSIRTKVLKRVNNVPGYVDKFSAIYPSAAAGNITFAQLAAAIAEFEFTLVFSDAPLDRYARGDLAALSDKQKRGADIFFGKADCVACHTVAGTSNEQFSDFDTHVAGIPQIAPAGFGLKPGGNPQNPADFPGNFQFLGKNQDEDFGREELLFDDPPSRYAFRTAPLRNIALQPAYFHNGAFTRLKDALRYHINTLHEGPKYNAVEAGVAPDLTVRQGPIEPVLKRLDPRLVALGNLNLSGQDFDDLYEFVRSGLLDQRALPENLKKLIPSQLPSGRKVLTFTGGITKHQLEND